jgi:hypothetical protein
MLNTGLSVDKNSPGNGSFDTYCQVFSLPNLNISADNIKYIVQCAHLMAYQHGVDIVYYMTQCMMDRFSLLPSKYSNMFVKIPNLMICIERGTLIPSYDTCHLFECR